MLFARQTRTGIFRVSNTVTILVGTTLRLWRPLDIGAGILPIGDTITIGIGDAPQAIDITRCQLQIIAFLDGSHPVFRLQPQQELIGNSTIDAKPHRQLPVSVGSALPGTANPSQQIGRPTELSGKRKNMQQCIQTDTRLVGQHTRYIHDTQLKRRSHSQERVELLPVGKLETVGTLEPLLAVEHTVIDKQNLGRQIFK